MCGMPAWAVSTWFRAATTAIPPATPSTSRKPPCSAPASSTRPASNTSAPLLLRRRTPPVMRFRCWAHSMAAVIRWATPPTPRTATSFRTTPRSYGAPTRGGLASGCGTHRRPASHRRILPAHSLSAGAWRRNWTPTTSRFSTAPANRWQGTSARLRAIGGRCYSSSWVTPRRRFANWEAALHSSASTPATL